MRLFPLMSLCLLGLGCSAKSDHGFVSTGEAAGLAPGGSGLSPWGSCGEGTPVDRFSDAVVQMAPPPGSQNVSAQTPIVLFMAEDYSLADIDAFDVTSNGWAIDGDLVELDREGAPVIGFAPLDPYDPASEVIVELDVAGERSEWQFHTGPYETSVAGDPNLSFESTATAQGVECEYTFFTDNFIGFGDVAFTDAAAGSTGATHGEARLLMTTGEVLGNASVRGTTSFVTSQPLPFVSAPELWIDYQVVAETSDADAEPHSDSFLVLAHGAQGVVFEEIARINAIPESETSPAEFPGLVNARATPWETHVVTGFNQVGADATITLFITDVGSTGQTSAVSVDNLRPQ